MSGYIKDSRVWKEQDQSLPTPNFYECPAVVLDNEIHIMGNWFTDHYKYSNNEWVRVGDLPYDFQNTSAVVLNGEIHAFGGQNNLFSHCKFSNGSWTTNVSTLPFEFESGSAVVVNGEIHILGGDGATASRTKHYKYSNGQWVEVSTLPYSFYKGSAVVINDIIYILGGAGGVRECRKYFNGQWVPLDGNVTLPYDFVCGSAVVIGTEIHIFGSDRSPNLKKHYKLVYGQWVQDIDIPYNFFDGNAVVLNGNRIHLLGGNYTTNYYIYYNGDSYWTFERGSALPYDFISYNNSSAVIIDDEINILGTTFDNGHEEYQEQWYKYHNNVWESVGTLPYPFYGGGVVVVGHFLILIGGGGTSSGWNGTWSYKNLSSGGNWGTLSLPDNKKFNGGSVVVLNDEVHLLCDSWHYKLSPNNSWTWTEVSELPYSFYNGSAVVLNGEIHILGGYSGTTGTSHYKYSNGEWIEVSTLPYSFISGSAVVLNNEIHILGGSSKTSSNPEKYNHYVYHDGVWKKVFDLSYGFRYGASVVLNNEIHSLGGYDSNDAHYIYKYITDSRSDFKKIKHAWFPIPNGYIMDGDMPIQTFENKGIKKAWIGTENNGVRVNKVILSSRDFIKLDDLPFNFYDGEAVVYHDKIHVFGGDNGDYMKQHWTWDGNSWNQEDDSGSFRIHKSIMAVYDDKINYWGDVSLYCWDEDNGWRSSRDVYGHDSISPFGNGWSNIYSRSTIVNQSELPPEERLPISEGSVFAICRYDHPYYFGIYQYPGVSSWTTNIWMNPTDKYALPVNLTHADVICYKGRIHLLGCSGNNDPSYITGYAHCHFKYVPQPSYPGGTIDYPSLFGLENDTPMPYRFMEGGSIVYQNKIHIFGSGNDYDSKQHWMWDGQSWTRGEDLPIGYCNGAILKYRGEIYIIGGAYKRNGFIKSNDINPIFN